MIHPSVEELLSQFTPEELASILREELEAVGIPYTCNANDTFEFAPISEAELEIPYESSEQVEMKIGKFVMPASIVKPKVIYDNATKEDSVITVNCNLGNKYQPTSDYRYAA